MSLLAVYNTCGIDCSEKLDWYITCIRALLEQDIPDCRVVLSSCRNSDAVCQALQQEFSDKISYNFIEDVVPVNVSFNFTVLRATEHRRYDGYLYIDSGVLTQSNDTVSRLYDIFINNNCGIASVLPSNDVGFHYEQTPDFTQHYVVPLGKAVNNHFQIFSDTLLGYYHKLLPDIFAGHCTESVFTFMCAALKLKWLVHNDSLLVEHICDVDKQSAGFCTHKYVAQTNHPTWDHPFCIPSIVNRLLVKDAVNAGLGYEESRHVLMHDTTQFDSDDYCINDDLKDIIKRKLFLTKEEFPYHSIRHNYYE